ncbi:MAG: flagellar hook-basal body complex protein FliE [Fimbriimonadales bacterium]
MNIASAGIQNSAIQQLADQATTHSAAKRKGHEEPDFAQTLMDVLKEVNNSQQNAVQVQNDFMTGRQSVDYHDLMIAMERANTAMNLTLAVRNKVLDAYQEIERLQV